jgi:hypothetical protein
MYAYKYTTEGLITNGDKTMQALDKYRGYAEENTEVLAWINTTLKAYLTRTHGGAENQTEIEHILDYLKSDKAPKRLGRMSYSQAFLNTIKWDRALIKKGNNIIELDSDIEVVYGFKGGGKLVRLIGEAAFKREGAMMRHCVASYFGNATVEIYSLRDTLNKPHCTIELKRGEGGQINQIKGKGNGSIHPRYIKAVLKSLKVLGKEIRLSEMANLGYIDLEGISPGTTKFLEQGFTGMRFLTMQGKKLFYQNSKLTRR